MKTGTCPKCLINKQLSRHHILPKCHFGNTHEIELICIPCHRDLEKFIESFEGKDKNKRRRKLKRAMYRLIYEAFIMQV